jgi:primosomal replication protein N
MVVSHNHERNIPKDFRWGNLYRQVWLLVPVGCVGAALANVTYKMRVGVPVKFPVY